LYSRTMKPELDMKYLVFAWQDESPDHNYYLDTEQGSVQFLERDLKDLRDLTDELETHSQRYLYLPKPNLAELKADIIDFIATITDTHLKNIATIAFESPDISGAFKKILAGKEELDRWLEFRDNRVRERIHEWLKANFVQI